MSLEPRSFARHFALPLLLALFAAPSPAHAQTAAAPDSARRSRPASITVTKGVTTRTLPLAPADTTHYSANAAANAKYLLARQYLAKREKRMLSTMTNARECWRLMDEATQSDTTFARAYLEKARLWAVLSFPSPGRMSSREIRKFCLEPARRAVALGEKNADAHAVLAQLLWNYEYDWQKAEWHFRRALTLDPMNALFHAGLAEMLGVMGRFEEALAEAARAESLGASFRTDFVNAQLRYWKGDAAGAAAYYRKALARQDNSVARQQLATTLATDGQFDEALQNFERAALLDERAGSTLALWAWALAKSGRVDEARTTLEEALSCCDQQKVVPYRIGMAWLAIGERDRAIEYLERDYQEHGPALARLAVDPLAAPIRTEARVKALLKKLGLGS